MTKTSALWGARFSNGPADSLAKLSQSTHFDWRLAELDLEGTMAHCKALYAAGYLSESESQVISAALLDLKSRVGKGSFKPKPGDEDVHSALERGLIDIVGPDLGGKIRAGRSRNDQIATLIRSFLIQHSAVLEALLLDYLDALLTQAEANSGVAMPGRTHFQHAQPVLLSHHLAAHAWPQVRNLQRLRQWRERASYSPYGAGALAGNTLGLDPRIVATELGFKGPTENSMDATASRDLVAEFAWIAAMIGVDLSRISEELVIWATAEFNYVKLHDSYSTGSSIMPQKKNPDIAELARGKAGRLIGNLTGLLTTLKGLPLAYNRDLQEDKEPVFDGVDTLELVIPALTGMIQTLEFNRDRLEELAPAGFSLATDVAEWLVKQGVPFRVAHEITGAMVLFCESNGKELHELTDAELAGISPHLRPEVREGLTVTGAIKGRSGAGGTALPEVLTQLIALRKVAPKRSSK